MGRRSARPGQDAVDPFRLSDLYTPWCIHVVATLRICDHLACREAAGPVAVEELAAAAGCDPQALDAVPGHLVGTGISEEPAPGFFARNDGARQLQAASPFLDLNGIGGGLGNPPDLCADQPARLPGRLRAALLGGPRRPSLGGGQL